MSYNPMLISNKLHQFHNFGGQTYEKTSNFLTKQQFKFEV